MAALSAVSSSRIFDAQASASVYESVKSGSGPTATDDKTTAVAGRILIGACVIIGAASICAALIVSASYAWGLALALVIGAIGERLLASSEATTSPTTGTDAPVGDSPTVGERHRAPFVPGQPVGIRRGSTMNCWAIALLQYMRHIPSLYNHVCNNFDILNNFYATYNRAGAESQHVAAGADSGRIRQWLSERTSISPRSGNQEDASEFLGFILGHFPPHDLQLTRGTGVARDVEARSFTINIASHRNRPLDQLFVENFLQADGNTQRFYNKPVELLFHLNRSGPWGKINDAINAPHRINLPGSSVLTGEGGGYECDAFVCHRGDSMHGGHYVAYIRTNGVWWLCDDEDVTPVSMADVNQARRLAYLLHYRAV